MNLPRLCVSLVCAAAIIAVAGCGSDPSSAPNTPASLDVSAVISQMSAGTLTGLPGASAMLGIPAAPEVASSVAASACAYSGASQSFVCPSIASNGVTFSASYWLYDASGHAQSQANAATTASVRAVVDAVGTVSGTAGTVSGSMTVANHSDLTMSGLLANMRILNGTSAGHDSLTGTGATPTRVVIDLTTTAANVVLPVQATGGSSWPQSGTLTVDAHTVTQTGALPTVSASAHAVITFNGTNIVPVTGTVGGIPVTCHVDLAGKVAPVCV